MSSPSASTRTQASVTCYRRAGYTARTNVSHTSDIELLAEDQVVRRATPAATVGTGAKTTWELATIVFKAGSQVPPTAPAAPTGVTAQAGNGSAIVSWNVPASGGSPITSYTLTPYVGATAQTWTVISGNPPPRARASPASATAPPIHSR